MFSELGPKKRVCSIFINYYSKTHDQVKSRFIPVFIHSIPVEVRKQYVNDRDLGKVLNWYFKQYFDEEIDVRYISILDTLDDFLYDSI